MRSEGFSCSLDVLYSGLEIIKLKFLQILVPDPDYRYSNAGFGCVSGFNESESESTALLSSSEELFKNFLYYFKLFSTEKLTENCFLRYRYFLLVDDHIDKIRYRNENLIKPKVFDSFFFKVFLAH